MRDSARLPIAVLAALGATLAATPLTATFAGPARPLVISSAAALIAAVMSVFVFARSRPVVQAAAAAGTLCLSGVAAVELTLVTTGRRAMPLLDAWSLVAGCWNATRGGLVPAPTDPELVALPVLVATAAALATGVTARQLPPALAAVPLLAAFGVSLCFTGGEAASAVATGGLLLVCLGLARLTAGHLGDRTDPIDEARVRVRGNRKERVGVRPPRWRRPAGAAIAGVTITGVAMAVGAAAPGLADEGRTDLRASYVPPLTSLRESHVLNLVASGLSRRSEPPVVFELHIDGPARPFRIRLAALDDYDGTTWTSSGRFTTVDRMISPAATGAGRVEQTYTLTWAYQSAYLPAIERPVRVRSLAGDDIGVDPEHHTLAHLAGGSDAEVRYRVTSSIPDPDRREQARDRRPDPTSRRLSPDQVAELADYLDVLPAGANPYDTLAAIEQDLRSRRFGYDPDAAAGHSIGRLAQFLGVSDVAPVPSADRTGTSEQPAAAFALLARMLGYESRVVVGYDVPAAAFGDGRAATVTADQIHAWSEVRFDSLGWIAFDPTNPTPRRPAQTPPDTTPVSPPRTSPPSTTPPPPDVVDEPRAAAEPDWHTPGLWLVVIGVLGILAWVAVIASRRVRRSLRRTRGSAERRVLGAWCEVKDRLRRRGLVVTPATTPADVVTACRRRVGESDRAKRVVRPELAVPGRWNDDLCRDLAQALVGLGPVLNTTLYAPAEPTDELAGRAWAIERRVSDALARGGRGR